MSILNGAKPWLMTSDVARLFGVDPKTVARWAQQGKLASTRTLSGHRRYRKAEVYTLLDSRYEGTLGGAWPGAPLHAYEVRLTVERPDDHYEVAELRVQARSASHALAKGELSLTVGLEAGDLPMFEVLDLGPEK